MNIAGRLISPSLPPYLIAEIGANHGGSLDRALMMIEAAKFSGADAVKFQAYTADTITLDHDGPQFTIKEGPWSGRRLYDLYKECETPFEWFPRIAEHAKKIGITCFASVFDESAVDLMVSLNAPAIKIASFELVDLPLIRYAAKTGLPIILSTGMASLTEIREAKSAAGSNAIFLHCVSGYPTPYSEANLRALTSPRKIECSLVGISDHTLGIEIPIAATALGAVIIEKHFTLSRRKKTTDADFSLEPQEFKRMAEAVRNTWAAMGPTITKSEEASRPLRRSLYAIADIKQGECLSRQNIRSIRPGGGPPPKELDSLIGKIALQDIPRGTPLSYDLIAE